MDYNWVQVRIGWGGTSGIYTPSIKHSNKSIVGSLYAGDLKCPNVDPGQRKIQSCIERSHLGRVPSRVKQWSQMPRGRRPRSSHEKTEGRSAMTISSPESQAHAGWTGVSSRQSTLIWLVTRPRSDAILLAILRKHRIQPSQETGPDAWVVYVGHHHQTNLGQWLDPHRCSYHITILKSLWMAILASHKSWFKLRRASRCPINNRSKWS